MNHCVPQWDVAGGDIDVAMHSTELFSLNRGEWDSVPQRKNNSTDKLYASDNEFEELCWDNGQLFIVTPGQDSKGHKQRNWVSNPSSDFSAIPEGEGAVPLTRLQSEKTDLDVAANDLASIADSYMQEDETVSWLHYPLDEPLEKYCSDLLTGTLTPGKDQERGDVVAAGEGLEGSSKKVCHSMSKPMTPETDRLNDSVLAPNTLAARNIHSLQPAVMSKRENNCFSINYSSDSNTLSSTSTVNMLKRGPGPTILQQMLAAKSKPGVAHPHSSSPLRKTTLNFSHFSRPAAAIKAKSQTLTMATGPTEIEQLKQLDRIPVEACMANESIRQQVMTELDSLCTTRDANSLLAVSESQKLDSIPGQQPVQSLFGRADADLKLGADNISNSNVNEKPNCSNHCATSSALLSMDRGTEILDTSEPTLTASSGGSGNSVPRTEKGAEVLEKRKARDTEDFECQSKAPEGVHEDSKKPVLTRLTSTKRSRAAEIHNQSERRRRDRINEKLRALQELIPNSNKTDKASLLEEVIEYLKMLQMQLQIMSFRSGMSISPMLIPPAIQHMQMAQMASLPHLAMGVGLGVGMGMLDMGAATTSRHVLPLPSFPGFPGNVIPKIPISAMAPHPGPIVATIPGPVLPAAAFSVPTLPVSALAGLPVLTPSQYTVVPTVTRAATDHRDLWTSKNRDHKEYHANQQLQADTQVNCKTASASSL